MAKVCCPVPYLYEISGKAMDSWMLAVDANGPNRACFGRHGSSLLLWNFNSCLAAALSTRKSEHWTHFLMIHADVVARTQFWLDILVAEMAKYNCDILHVVLPIKNESGNTSTAVEDLSDRSVRRLTLHELHRLPETFYEQDGKRVLQSSGFWLMDLRRPWVEELWPSVYAPSLPLAPCFSSRDRLVQREDGSWFADTYPEDWGWSQKLYARVPGLKIWGTRKIVCGHIGPSEYPNNQPYGPDKPDAEVFNFDWAQ